MRRNVELETRVKELEHKKTSKNSSVPPSKDENRGRKHFTRSLRKKSGKKSGGQHGHTGHTLEMSTNPDKIIDHEPLFCEGCGEQLEEEKKLLSHRQVVDIPPIQLEITEHRLYEKQCNCCGLKTSSNYPSGVNSPISYGKNVQTLIAYMSVRHYISMNRIKEFMSEVLGVNLSEGTVQNILKRYSKNCEFIYDQIRQRLLASEWVGSDETGCKVNGKRYWMWTWQNDQMTYIAASNNRGSPTINEHFPDGLPNSILVHDCWRPHFNVESRGNQLCLAHLLRELQFFIEKRGHLWAYQFSQILYKSIALKKKILNQALNDQDKAVDQIKRQTSILIGQTIVTEDKKLASFHRRMIKYKKHLLMFLNHENIPFDNNSSERAIRNVKVKTKVSGMFKTYNGAQNFAIIRSVIDTCIKNNSSIFNTLALVPE